MAGRKCSICEHKSRHEIDSALVSPGASLRAIAQQYRVSKDALSRHIKAGHIEEKIQKAANAYEAIAGEGLLRRIDSFHKRFAELAKKQQGLGDDLTELKVYQTQAKYLELEGKATGAFKEKVEHSGTVEVLGKMSDEEVIDRARSILARK
ncbi:hypothetical protein [Methanoregula sp.]|jgi:hypothetical protein|uniref:hypothetical protein n=1 Tax=Methanoregula sp. TaxID=2052170 RepID=UPI00356708C7